MLAEGCPKCGSIDISGSFDSSDAFQKRGCKFVRKRSVKFVVIDWVCKCCGHKWSARNCISGVRFRRRRRLE